MMKHVAFAIGSLSGGGAERVVSVWASALAEKGYKVSAIVYSRVEDEYDLNKNVNIYPIAQSQQACKNMPMVKRVFRFRKVLKQIKPDIVISFLPVVQVYVRYASIGLKHKRVETIRINPWKTEISNSKYYKSWLKCFDKCDHLILQSKDQKPFFSEKVQKKAVTIPNPINALYLENEKKEYDANSHKIVAAGRLTKQKNYKMLIDAIKIVQNDYNDVSLSIYGAGELQKELQDYIDDIGISNNVKLMGRSNELHNVYKDFDLYVMSSDYEGLPNALAEAMAIGLPCISTDCQTGPRDLIDDGISGYLTPCGDVKALADKIKETFSLTSDEQRVIGQSAREKIKNFCSEENSLKQLINLIESL